MSERISLYRKYRPENFSNIVGQTAIVKTLKMSLLNNKISHAYLFSGPRGTGKTSIAKIVAKLFNCQNSTNGELCGKCLVCTMKNNSDIIELDAASNNGVEEIRSIIATANFIPNNGKYKVYIIDEVHMLSIGAFNALLKTMEEPPPHVIFILATTEINKIPKTILSRCQKFEFKKITPEQMIIRLQYISKQENINISEESLREISILSEGAARDAINMLDQISSTIEPDKNKTIEINDIHELIGTLQSEQMEYFLGNIFLGNIEQSLVSINEYISTGKNLIKIADEMIRVIKNKIIEDYTNKKSCVGYFEAIKTIQENIQIIKNSSDLELAFELMILKLICNKKEENISSEKIITEIKSNKKEELTKQEKKIINDQTIKQSDIQNKINIRVNNALSSPDKKLKILIETQIKNIVINEAEYQLILPLIEDSIIAVASDEYIVFLTNYISGAERFNDNLLQIEKLINKITNNNYRVIAISNQEWDVHRNQFIKDKSKYKYEIEIDDVKEEEEHELEKLFGKDIVEIK